MAYESQCPGVFYESDNVIKKASQFKKSELGRREGMTSEMLLLNAFEGSQQWAD